MPWASQVPAILEAFYPGIRGGAAIARILTGKVNPSGHLPITFPASADQLAHPVLAGKGMPGETPAEVVYDEGAAIGYKWYDLKGYTPLWSFGHGLSYTAFAYSNLRLSARRLEHGSYLHVSADVTNTGSVAGKEIVQLYVASAHKGISRPEKELKQFSKVSLNPGETKTVTMTLDRRAFAYYEVSLPGWQVENGAYRILLGASSRDIRLEADIEVTGAPALPRRFSMDSTLGDVMNEPQGKDISDQIMQGIPAFLQAADEGSALSPEMIAAMMRDMPLHTIVSFSEGRIDRETLNGMIRTLNGET
jgi:beta-glucosidase